MDKADLYFYTALAMLFAAIFGFFSLVIYFSHVEKLACIQAGGEVVGSSNTCIFRNKP